MTTSPSGESTSNHAGGGMDRRTIFFQDSDEDSPAIARNDYGCMTDCLVPFAGIIVAEADCPGNAPTLLKGSHQASIYTCFLRKETNLPKIVVVYDPCSKSDFGRVEEYHEELKTSCTQHRSRCLGRNWSAHDSRCTLSNVHCRQRRRLVQRPRRPHMYHTARMNRCLMTAGAIAATILLQTPAIAGCCSKFVLEEWSPPHGNCSLSRVQTLYLPTHNEVCQSTPNLFQGCQTDGTVDLKKKEIQWSDPGCTGTKIYESSWTTIGTADEASSHGGCPW